ncbi:hypothetical protein ElyMa_005335200 [Elysia marginata]|uniref:Uncharacterized protein n=1 Tax=Elysia marginata TaxID=1093978 RepID=A0AAV4E9G8_9GAST|nr:hypothetical protein ElyMa_005335200 [Elysia marginata]
MRKVKDDPKGKNFDPMKIHGHANDRFRMSHTAHGLDNLLQSVENTTKKRAFFQMQGKPRSWPTIKVVTRIGQSRGKTEDPDDTLEKSTDNPKAETNRDMFIPRCHLRL